MSHSLIRSHLDAWAAVMEECGVQHWVYSPGSRNAPLIAALMRRPFFILHEQIDERSAAYCALGMAQQLKSPAAVLCTSGTAAANWLPAACEAFYLRIPLILVSADRPIESVDQWSGQTIRQDELYHRHVRAQYRVSDDLDQRPQHAELEELMHSAIRQSLYPTAGPVHLNFPLREPLYLDMDDQQPLAFVTKAFVWSKPNAAPVVWEQIQEALRPYTRIALLLGQGEYHPDRAHALENLQNRVAIWADVCSQHQHLGTPHWENFVQVHSHWPPELEPELIISTGMSQISKPLQTHISQSKPTHWHVSESLEFGDPFGTKPLHWPHYDMDFLAALDQLLPQNLTFGATWQKATESHSSPLTKRPEEYQGARLLLESLQEDDVLHLGNSMPVRYASWFGKLKGRVYANRGTSGIDGSLSSAVGAALVNPHQRHFALLGDLSFIYDQHALWSREWPQNLSIAVLNNQGGRIFEQIAGPSQWPQLQERMVSPQQVSLKALCEQYGVRYIRCSAEECAQQWRQSNSLHVYEIPC